MKRKLNLEKGDEVLVFDRYRLTSEPAKAIVTDFSEVNDGVMVSLVPDKSGAIKHAIEKWPEFWISENQIKVTKNENQKEFDPMLNNFSYKHLPEKLQEISKDFSELAHQMACRGYDNIPETMAGLRKLLEAKDCAVRAVLN